ncbi:MAG: CopG family transcriptional regulator [Gemmatimonadales bacterium]
MATTKRATVYFDAGLHRALRLKAAETEQSVSELVNAAVRRNLTEDAVDLEAFTARSKEPNLAFESVLRDMRRRGRL